MQGQLLLKHKYCTCINRKDVSYISPAGRPPKENPRNINLNIRITKDEARRIQTCANKLNTSRTDAIMKGIELVEEQLKK